MKFHLVQPRKIMKSFDLTEFCSCLLAFTTLIAMIGSYYKLECYIQALRVGRHERDSRQSQSRSGEVSKVSRQRFAGFREIEIFALSTMEQFALKKCRE